MSQTVQQIIERCQALFEDLNFTSVKEWKAAVPGRKVIGFMPIYVPREIIHAAGMLPVGIMGGGDQLEVIQGDAYYQSYICRIPRSTLELGLTGRLDCLDGMLFPSICDVIRNLSGMWQILFKDKYVRYFDVPQNYQDGVGGEYYIHEMQVLREDLGKLAGKPITDDALRASIAVYNENRRAVQDLYKYRSAKPWQAPTAEVYLVLRAGMVLPVEEYTQLVRDYIAATDAVARPMRDNARIVLTGAFCEQPPLSLIKSIEMAGCYIVDDDFMLVMRMLFDDVPVTGDPLDELSKAFLHRSIQTSSKYDEFKKDKGKYLLDSTKLNAGEGVIFAAPSFCDPALLERPMLQSVLNEHKIPYTAFKYAENTGQMAPDPRAGRNFCRFDQTLERRHEHTCIQMTPPQASKKAGPAGAERGRDAAAEGNDQPQLPRTRHRAPARQEGRGHLRAGQPERAGDVLRLRPQPARDQRAAERHAQEIRQDDHGRRARRPFRGRVHLRQGRPRHDAGRRGRPDRRAPAPRPDLLLLSYTGCFTFMKWFELIRQKYNCETTMLHVPYQGDGKISKNMRDYVVKQIKENVIPSLERVSGVKFDIDRLRQYMKESAKAEEDLVHVLQSAKNRPSPIDGYFGAVYYIGPIFTAFRGTKEATEYYRVLRQEIEQRVREGKGPITPEGEMAEEKYRLVVEGPPNWTSFREFWKMFYDEGAVVVTSTYAKVGGVYDFGFRHDPDHPIESLAEYCLGCYTNLNLPQRIDMICKYIDEYQADGLLINSIKSCNSFSAGQLLILREVEKRTGKPAAFIESDLVDPRYFSAANIKNRLESYFQMIKQKRTAAAGAVH